MNVEYEKKQLLTLAEYRKLSNMLNKLVVFDEVVQINYYYDDESFSLNNENVTLRIRQINDKLMLEKKYNQKYSEDGTRICDEKIIPIYSFPPFIINNNKKFFYVGELITVRKNYKFCEYIISLDVNYYLGKIDYEIEVEAQKKVAVPNFILNKIKFGSFSPGKYSRFVLRKKELQL